VEFKGLRLDCGYRLDLLVAKTVVVEIKAVESLSSIHEAQLLTCLKLGGGKVGLLINFNVSVLKNGIRRRVALGRTRDLCVLLLTTGFSVVSSSYLGPARPGWGVQSAVSDGDEEEAGLPLSRKDPPVIARLM
jgi:hypothetical protein